MQKATSSIVLGYGLAVLSVGIALLCVLVLLPFLDVSHSFLLLVAVVVSAWYRGLGPGLLATLLSTATHYFLMRPALSSETGLERFADLMIFVLVALLIIWLNAARQRIERVLAESKNLLRMVIETEPECVKLLGPNGILQEMNRAGLEMIEAESLAQVSGKSVLGLIVPATNANLLIQQAQALSRSFGL